MEANSSNAVRELNLRNQSPLMRPEELAEYLGVPLGTIYAWNHRRRGPQAFKVGRHLRFRRSDVETWLEQQGVEPDS